MSEHKPIMSLREVMESEEPRAIENAETEKWTIRDMGGIGVRDVRTKDKIVCIDVPVGIAMTFCKAHNATLPASRPIVATEQKISESETPTTREQTRTETGRDVWAYDAYAATLTRNGKLFAIVTPREKVDTLLQALNGSPFEKV